MEKTSNEETNNVMVWIESQFFIMKKMLARAKVAVAAFPDDLDAAAQDLGEDLQDDLVLGDIGDLRSMLAITMMHKIDWKAVGWKILEEYLRSNTTAEIAKTPVEVTTCSNNG